MSDVQRIPLCALWKKEGKRGEYYSGKFDKDLLDKLKAAGVSSVSEMGGCAVVFFPETDKKNPKGPDLKGYLLPPRDESDPF
jgi:hypothetical protein